MRTFRLLTPTKSIADVKAAIISPEEPPLETCNVKLLVKEKIKSS